MHSSRMTTTAGSSDDAGVEVVVEVVVELRT